MRDGLTRHGSAVIADPQIGGDSVMTQAGKGGVCEESTEKGQFRVSSSPKGAEQLPLGAEGSGLE